MGKIWNFWFFKWVFLMIDDDFWWCPMGLNCFWWFSASKKHGTLVFIFNYMQRLYSLWWLIWSWLPSVLSSAGWSFRWPGVYLTISIPRRLCISFSGRCFRLEFPMVLSNSSCNSRESFQWQVCWRSVPFSN